MKFFSSDFHFWHRNILKYQSNRPFETIDKMNDYIVDNLNQYVKKGDILYHLGDFAFCSLENIIKIRRKIKCKNIVLVAGNHDSFIHSKLKIEKVKEFFKVIDNISVVKDNGHRIVIAHYPIEEWPSRRRSYLHFHGHSHNRLENRLENRWDVGVDTRNFDGSCLAYTVEELLKDDNYREAISKAKIQKS